ncbi:MAG TPA: hypothetical protein VKS01_11955 [Bryobacteraceae bacterium]|nr:hypothetical protein [Bryobacteraceae bacterium]
MEKCHLELITVVDPFQVIVQIDRRGQFHQFYYLRYMRVGTSGLWKFNGLFSAISKYAEPYHRTDRIGKRTVLIVGHEVYQGFDWTIRKESWFDLTLSKFEPVFEFSPMKAHNGTPDPMIVFQSFGEVVEANESEFRVAYSMRFELGQERPLLAVPMLAASAVYKRRDDRYEFDPAASSKMPAKDFDELYGFDLGPSTDFCVHLLLPDLKKVAQGSDGKRREWLGQFLREAGDTAEKRELMGMLAAPR